MLIIFLIALARLSKNSLIWKQFGILELHVFRNEK